MISTQDRQDAIELINEAVKAGARRARACQELGLCERTYRRWLQGGSLQSDRRSEALRPRPANALSLAEKRGLEPLVLHSDNGSPMKGATMLVTLQKLGIAASFSRPGVSDDNAQVEAFFRTLKYRPGYPAKGFLTLEAVRQWVRAFVSWYNFEHRHSAIKFVTPAQRHGGEDIAILRAREDLYQQAKATRPERWRGFTRDWSRPEVVWLNPAPDRPKETATAA